MNPGTPSPDLQNVKGRRQRGGKPGPANDDQHWASPGLQATPSTRCPALFTEKGALGTSPPAGTVKTAFVRGCHPGLSPGAQPSRPLVSRTTGGGGGEGADGEEGERQQQDGLDSAGKSESQRAARWFLQDAVLLEGEIPKLSPELQPSPCWVQDKEESGCGP